MFLVLKLIFFFTGTTAGWNAQPYSTNFGLKPDPAKIVLRQKLDLHQVSFFPVFVVFCSSRLLDIISMEEKEVA